MTENLLDESLLIQEPLDALNALTGVTFAFTRANVSSCNPADFPGQEEDVSVLKWTVLVALTLQNDIDTALSDLHTDTADAVDSVDTL